MLSFQSSILIGWIGVKMLENILSEDEIEQLNDVTRDIYEALLTLSAESQGDTPIHYFGLNEIYNAVKPTHSGEEDEDLLDEITSIILSTFKGRKHKHPGAKLKIKAITEGPYISDKKTRTYYRTEIPHALRDKPKESVEYKNGRGRPNKYRQFNSLFVPPQARVYLRSALRDLDEKFPGVRRFWRPEQIFRMAERYEGEYNRTAKPELLKQFKSAHFEEIFTPERVIMTLRKMGSEGQIYHATVSYPNKQGKLREVFRYNKDKIYRPAPEPSPESLKEDLNLI